MHREGRLFAEGYRRMKFKAFSGMMLTLILMGMLILTFNIQPVEAEPTTIIVPDDDEKIQWAVGNATEGDTILVKAGTYNEHVFVDKTLTLIGENKSNTIISGLGLGHGPSWGLVSITASNAVVTGFTIRDSTTSAQIGVFMRNSYHCNISSNVIANHYYGIDMRESEDNFIGNNTISGCNVYGISISESSKNNILRNNNLTGNDWNLGVFSYFFHDIDTSNIVDGKPVYYCVNQKDKQIPNDAGYVALVNSTSMVVKNLTITHNQGVLLAHSINSTIENVNVSTSLRGFYLVHSHNNTISGCDTTQTIEGIRLEDSNDNKILGNTLSNYSDIGIMFENSQRNAIFNNTVSVDWMYSDSFWISGTNNNIYHNNILHHYKRFFSDGSPNTWDNGYPSGGNYWSDYTGTDLYFGPYQNIIGSDGIGDTPYIIDENNRDNYPLMDPWTPTAPVITATIDINPDTLNLKSRGKWITCYIELPEGYNVGDIDRATIMLNGTIPVDQFWINKPLESVVGDYDSDTIPDLMVKFSRAAVIEYLLSQKITYGSITLTVTGEFYDGTLFEDSDMIRVKMLSNAMAKMPSEVNSDNENTLVMPEFSSFLILPLFMMSTLLAVIVHRRKHTMKH